MDYIKAENVSLKRDDKTLLNNLSINIQKGTIYGILCEDKETNTAIAELIIGNELPDTGEIFVDSLDSSKDSEKIREFTGIVSSGYKMYSYMTAYNNLVFFGRLKTNNQPYVTDRASYLMHELNVWHTHDKKLSDADSSSKRKLSIALSLLTRPSLLLLDEPFNKLDRSSQEDVKNFIRTIAKSEDITVVICSEDPADLSICDEFSVIKSSECVVSGDFNALKKYSGLKNKAYIKCNNCDLTVPELNMELCDEGTYIKELDENGKISELIRAAVMLGADIDEAIVKVPEFITVCDEILKKEIGEGE